jgi:hypothetical protein
MERSEPDPKQGSIEMHNGATLFWETNAAGGRSYWSDEVGGGVQVWDTALVSFASLCEAISMELALQATERRLGEQGARAYVREQLDSLGPSFTPDEVAGE